MRIAVLGSGPAGLLAAHASMQAGHETKVFSVLRKSVIAGAQYLHEEIPEITRRSFNIEYRKQGTRDGYAQKVYGDPDHVSSWERFDEGLHQGWDLREAYDKLWSNMFPYMSYRAIAGQTVNDLVDRYDWVFSTIPLRSICTKGHKFESSVTWVRKVGPRALMRDEIIYNGEIDVPWFRYSTINGVSWIEHAHDDGMSNPVWKPQATTCDCHRSVIKLGRYGKWKRDVLTTDAYNEVRDILS